MKDKLLKLPNRHWVITPIGSVENLHKTLNLLDENKPEDLVLIKSLYLSYDKLKSRAKRR